MKHSYLLWNVFVVCHSRCGPVHRLIIRDSSCSLHMRELVKFISTDYILPSAALFSPKVMSDWTLKEYLTGNLAWHLFECDYESSTNQDLVLKWKSKMVYVCNNHFIQSYIWLKSITKGVLLRQTDRQAMHTGRKENNKNVIPLCVKSKLQHLLASPAGKKKILQFVLLWLTRLNTLKHISLVHPTCKLNTSAMQLLHCALFTGINHI